MLQNFKPADCWMRVQFRNHYALIYATYLAWSYKLFILVNRCKPFMAKGLIYLPNTPSFPNQLQRRGPRCPCGQSTGFADENEVCVLPYPLYPFVRLI